MVRGSIADRKTWEANKTVIGKGVRMQVRYALILGHFSTVGDVECLETVKHWCKRADLPYDIAPYSKSLQRIIVGAISPGCADPRRYSHLLVVCGPCYPELLRKNGVEIERYAHCHRVGINLTMVAPLRDWNPFDLLLERDSDRTVRPDLAFLTRGHKVPVLGRCVVARQREYGNRQRHDLALALIDDLIMRQQLPAIEIDTHWPRSCSLIIPNSVESLTSLIARVDVLITNRLHGLVFSLHVGVPALAIDAVAGGDKLSAQARVLNWPACLLAERATPTRLDEVLSWCLTSEARSAAAVARELALKAVGHIEGELAKTLSLAVELEESGTPGSGRGRSWPWWRPFKIRRL